MKIHLKRYPDGSPSPDGPCAILPEDALFVHVQVSSWVQREFPDITPTGALIVAYVEDVQDPALKTPWGSLVTTFTGGSGDRYKIAEARIGWLQRQTFQAYALLSGAVGKLLDASRLTSDEAGN